MFSPKIPKGPARLQYPIKPKQLPRRTRNFPATLQNLKLPVLNISATSLSLELEASLQNSKLRLQHLFNFLVSGTSKLKHLCNIPTVLCRTRSFPVVELFETRSFLSIASLYRDFLLRNFIDFLWFNFICRASSIGKVNLAGSSISLSKASSFVD